MYRHRALIEGLTETKAREYSWAAFTNGDQIPNRMFRSISNDAYFVECSSLRVAEELVPNLKADLWKLGTHTERNEYIANAFESKILPYFDEMVPNASKFLKERYYYKGGLTEFLIGGKFFQFMGYITDKGKKDDDVKRFKKLQKIVIG
jgi:hypothetical protein